MRAEWEEAEGADFEETLEVTVALESNSSPKYFFSVAVGLPADRNAGFSTRAMASLAEGRTALGRDEEIVPTETPLTEALEVAECDASSSSDESE